MEGIEMTQKAKRVYRVQNLDGFWVWLRSDDKHWRQIWITGFEERFYCHPLEAQTFYPEGIVF